MTTEPLKEKAKKCLAQTPVTSSPLWHMGKASLGSKDSFLLLQQAIDNLTCKAKAKQSFTKDEKEFMKEIFEALWWGGRYKGFKDGLSYYLTTIGVAKAFKYWTEWDETWS